MTFAEAAATRAEFAQELPRFVSEIRRMFPPGEIRAHLGQIERALDYNNMEALEEDDPLCEDPDAAAKPVRQFIFIKELLTATALGTSSMNTKPSKRFSLRRAGGFRTTTSSQPRTTLNPPP